MGSTGETAVGDEGDVGGQAGPHERRGGREHLGHPRPALRSLVADDDDVPALDAAPLERGEHRLLAVENPRGATEAGALLAGDLRDGAARGEVAVEDRDVTGGLDRLIHRMDHLLARPQPRAGGEVLRERLAGDRQAVAVEQAPVEQVLHESARASRGMQVLLDEPSAGLEVGEVGHAAGDGLEVGGPERHLHRAGHGDQVEHGVRRATERHDDDHGVFEGPPRHDVAGLEIALEQPADRGCRPEALVELAGVLGRDRRRVGKRHAERLDRGCHRVGGVHAAAGARPGAGMPHDVGPTGVVDPPGHVLAITLERRDDVERGAVGRMARLDRPAIHHERRSIEPPHGDEAAGHVLVTPRDCHERVVPLRVHHRLDRIGDDVSRGEGVAHSLRAHRHAVADADRVEPHPDETRGHRPLAHPRREPVEVHVAGVPLVPHARDPDLGLVEVGGLEARRVQHRLGSALRTGLRDA